MFKKKKACFSWDFFGLCLLVFPGWQLLQHPFWDIWGKIKIQGPHCSVISWVPNQFSFFSLPFRVFLWSLYTKCQVFHCIYQEKEGKVGLLCLPGSSSPEMYLYSVGRYHSMFPCWPEFFTRGELQQYNWVGESGRAPVYPVGLQTVVYLGGWTFYSHSY